MIGRSERRRDMKSRKKLLFRFLFLALLILPLMSWGQETAEEEPDSDEKKTNKSSVVENEVSVGLYYLDHDSYRYGKYTGLVDEGFYALADFRIEQRPAWDSGDTRRWKVQGWRLGLDSRRLVYNYNDPVKQSFSADYREIPNYRFDDGQSPYLNAGENTQTLPSSWEVAPGSSNTSGFLTLQENLLNLKVKTKRRWLDMDYTIKLSPHWNFAVNYDYISKKGERTIGSIFGYTGGNPRAVILAAPVDYMTNNVEAMFNYATSRAQFGFGVYASFFNNDETSLTWQNAYGHQSQWAPSVEYPGSQGRLALEPDNSYWQVKAYGAWNFTRTTRLTANASYGQMKQNDALLPYTVNPDLLVEIPVPLASLDGKVNTSMFSARLTSRLARPLNLAVNYTYNDRNNKTPRAVYPYIGGDSQDQRPYEEGRINLPYSYTKQRADAILTYRLGAGTRLKGGVEYYDTHRDYSEVSDAEEWAWVAGIKFGGFQTAAFNFDYRDSSRDVDSYIGNIPLIDSHLPGVIHEDEWENSPLLRKYYLTDRDRQEFRFRADVFPVPEWNFGLALVYFKDDYADGYYGLNRAKITSGTIDVGWYPIENISVTGFYTKEKYDADQSGVSFRNAAGESDPDNQWWASTTDKVDTWNLALNFTDIGADRGWKKFDLGFDYTLSNTRGVIDVTAATATTAPLPRLTDRWRSFSAWARIAVSSHSSLRFVVEGTQLNSANFALDNVETDTLANVLLLGESAANYDILLITGSWIYQF